MPSKALEYWIITQNIARFQELLKAETDEAKRAKLQELLAQEQAKLGTPIPRD